MTKGALKKTIAICCSVTKNMETGSNSGDTIIALYPHQWRYANSKFTGYTYDTIRGTLIGYPTSYDSDKQLNDHHFHYGYWIKAAATVAMKDTQWAKEWGGMVYEMISNIANTNRDGSSYGKFIYCILYKK